MLAVQVAAKRMRFVQLLIQPFVQASWRFESFLNLYIELFNPVINAGDAGDPGHAASWVKSPFSIEASRVSLRLLYAL